MGYNIGERLNTMKSVGIRALRERPGIFTQCAKSGEYLLLTNRNSPVSISIPFDDNLLKSGVQINMASKLFEDGLLTLTKASVLANLSVEAFLAQLAIQGITVVDQAASELESDLKALAS